jgi:hypothetical protein
MTASPSCAGPQSLCQETVCQPAPVAHSGTQNPAIGWRVLNMEYPRTTPCRVNVILAVAWDLSVKAYRSPHGPTSSTHAGTRGSAKRWSWLGHGKAALGGGAGYRRRRHRALRPPRSSLPRADRRPRDQASRRAGTRAGRSRPEARRSALRAWAPDDAGHLDVGDEIAAASTGDAGIAAGLTVLDELATAMAEYDEGRTAGERSGSGRERSLRRRSLGRARRETPAMRARAEARSGACTWRRSAPRRGDRAGPVPLECAAGPTSDSPAPCVGSGRAARCRAAGDRRGWL